MIQKEEEKESINNMNYNIICNLCSTSIHLCIVIVCLNLVPIVMYEFHKTENWLNWQMWKIDSENVNWKM